MRQIWVSPGNQEAGAADGRRQKTFPGRDGTGAERVKNTGPH